MAGAALHAALRGDEGTSLLAAAACVDGLAPDAKRSILCSLSTGEVWAALFHRALRSGEEEACVWGLLALLTDIKPPPLRDLEAQFGDPALLGALVAGLGLGHIEASKIEVCHCVRNLARVPKLRSMLQDAIEPLVGTLTGSSPDLSGAVAAALCNVACTNVGKEKAVSAGALPLLLSNLSNEDRPSVADDIVAGIGVLTCGLRAGAEAVVASAPGVSPLLKALRLGCPVPAIMALEVLSDLAIVLGPTGEVALRLASDGELVSQDLPRLVVNSNPGVRGGALKLCALLLELEGFHAGFASGGGADAMQAALDLEPPAPPAPPLVGRPGPRGTPGKLQLCNPGCDQACCFDVPGLSPQRPPTRREIAEQLLQQFKK